MQTRSQLRKVFRVAQRSRSWSNIGLKRHWQCHSGRSLVDAVQVHGQFVSIAGISSIAAMPDPKCVRKDVIAASIFTSLNDSKVSDNPQFCVSIHNPIEGLVRRAFANG